MQDEGSKRCTYCGEAKPRSAFYVRRDRGKERLSACCRACTKFARTPEGKAQAAARREARTLRQRPTQPCKKCGGSKPRGHGRKLCDTCERVHDIRDVRPPCERCGKRPREPRIFVCGSCRREREAEREARGPCPDCGGERAFARRFCDRCRDVRKWQSAVERRARLRGAFVERVDPFVVFDRSYGLCGICRLGLDVFSFEVDHIVPLARGGEHSYRNVHAAHRSCNRRKHTKLLSELAA